MSRDRILDESDNGNLEWAERVIERGTGRRACRVPMTWNGWETYCVEDEGHDGEHVSYGEVLGLGWAKIAERRLSSHKSSRGDTK